MPNPDAAQQAFWGVSNFIEAYLKHAALLYVKNEKPTSEYTCMKSALAPLNELFGSTKVHEFGARKLKLVREEMVRRKWSRRFVNNQINRIRRVFKWGVSEELIAPAVLQALQAVDGLRYGKSMARETDPVRPVSDAHVDATVACMTPVLAAMVRIQRLTGMRPGELVMMRPCDVDRRGEVWLYSPQDHKTRHRGHDRHIPLGPKAQALLAPYLDRPAETYVFSPQESEEQRHAEQRKNRKSPLTPSQRNRKPKKLPKRGKRQHFDVASYRRAITYAVRHANALRKAEEEQIPNWHPHQLRHTRATEVREQFGLDAAQSVLGH